MLYLQVNERKLNVFSAISCFYTKSNIIEKIDSSNTDIIYAYDDLLLRAIRDAYLDFIFSLSVLITSTRLSENFGSYELTSNSLKDDDLSMFQF
jgi:hypothetical protein